MDKTIIYLTECTFESKYCLNLPKIDTFHRKPDRKKIPGVFLISGFDDFFSRSESVQEIIQQEGAEEKSLSSGINIRIEKIYSNLTKIVTLPFSEFSSFSGFRRFMIF